MLPSSSLSAIPPTSHKQFFLFYTAIDKVIWIYGFPLEASLQHHWKMGPFIILDFCVSSLVTLCSPLKSISVLCFCWQQVPSSQAQHSLRERLTYLMTTAWKPETILPFNQVLCVAAWGSSCIPKTKWLEYPCTCTFMVSFYCWNLIPLSTRNKYCKYIT